MHTALLLDMAAGGRLQRCGEFIAVVEGGAANVFNRHPGLDGRYDNWAAGPRKPHAR